MPDLRLKFRLISGNELILDFFREKCAHIFQYFEKKLSENYNEISMEVNFMRA